MLETIGTIAIIFTAGCGVWFLFIQIAASKDTTARRCGYFIVNADNAIPGTDLYNEIHHPPVPEWLQRDREERDETRKRVQMLANEKRQQIDAAKEMLSGSRHAIFSHHGELLGQVDTNNPTHLLQTLRAQPTAEEAWRQAKDHARNTYGALIYRTAMRELSFD